ncbi:hypothetical protein VTJ83DRAFT_734 [Remersonia thermophila]|uniref:Prolyl 4-hydroxylase alpha subunit domain-containing protein n=1 Tax=Remersonia thermophila TaxID=72144 RepID=A0ABR4DLS8_9PEZI
MTASGVAKAAGIWAGGLLLGLGLPHLSQLSSAPLTSLLSGTPLADYPFAIPFLKPSLTKVNATTAAAAAANATAPEPFVCDTAHSYTTELVSLDPLIIYIHNLITPDEIRSLLETAEPRFAPSRVAKYGRVTSTSDRTSVSAGLPRDDPAVQCVLGRARQFLGTMLRDGWDEMGAPQLVRYETGQHFNLHHDWFDVPQWSTKDDDLRKWNRVASFFAILEDDCTAGETYFPDAKPIVRKAPWGAGVWQGKRELVEAKVEEEKEKEEEQEQQSEEGAGGEKKAMQLTPPLWREHEEGGLAFRPVAGNAIFWVNLHTNGTGDMRTVHAGLPLGSGRKTAMNIWPRQYYEY